MVHQLQPERSGLHVAHQSEVVKLQKQVALLQAQISDLQKNNPMSVRKKINKITLPVNGGYELVSCDQIVYCEAQGNYSVVHVINKSGNKQLLISKTLKNISTLLPAEGFIRCHQSYLVNLKHTAGYHTKGGTHLILKNQKEIPVSRRRKTDALRAVKK